VWSTPIRVPVIDLSRYELLEEPRFLMNLDSIKNKFNINNFSLTGIEVQP